jgi:hypothetical protein
LHLIQNTIKENNFSQNHHPKFFLFF